MTATVKQPQDRRKKKWEPPAPADQPEKAVVAWIAGGQTSMAFTTSLAVMGVRDVAMDHHLVQVLNHWSGPNISDARNYLTSKFLDEYPTASWLMWIDADMEFPADAMHELILSANADPESEAYAPIVGGLCFGEDAGTGLFPTIYAFQMTPEGQTQCIRLGDYPDDALFEVAATGTAFLLIHRSVLEAMREKRFNDTYPFFQELEMNGRPVGEDIGFCARARSLGFPIFVNTSVKIGHHKSHILTAEMFRRQQGAKESAPPATERVDVIVPVLNRPRNARPFMESLRASTGLAEVFAICEDDDVDTTHAWYQTDAIVIEGAAHTFAEKVNVGVKKGAAPWVLIVGDDVRFHPGWLDEALAAAGDRYDVVGTNDLGNPRVVSGEHGTHLLIRRSYIEEQGASWDGPGLIAHEGYHHWFVDDEIVTAAKQRDTWTSAFKSVIEHLHPLWGKAEEDSTYLEGQKHRFEDEALFRARLAEHTFGGAA